MAAIVRLAGVLELQVHVNAEDVGHVPAAVDFTDASVDDHIPVAVRRRAEPAEQVGRNWMDALSEIGAKHDPFPDTGIVVWVPVLRAKSCRRVSLVLVAPVLRCLAILVVELMRLLVTCFVMFLRQSHCAIGSCPEKQYRCRD
jgi:hypothetical protein